MNKLSSIATILAAISMAVTAHAGGLALQTGSDNSTGATVVDLLATDGSVIATQSWSSAVPSGWNGTHTAFYVPTQLLGELRDTADGSSNSDHLAGAAWMRTLMGSYANTSVSSIPGNALSTISVGVETSAWCGYSAGTDGRCPTGCNPTGSGGVTDCTSCGCKGTKTFN